MAARPRRTCRNVVTTTGRRKQNSPKGLRPIEHSGLSAPQEAGMVARTFHMVLAVVLLGVASAHAEPPSEFGQSLREADAIRTSNSARFSKLVLELGRQADGATPAE